MSCSLHSTVLSKSQGVRVNDVVVPRDVIAREVQHHPARNPAESLKAAARALVVRELLLQEARRLKIEAEPLSDSDGRRETAEEAMIRTLVDRKVRTPTADEATCRRYYDQNQQRFCSSDIYEAAHILFAASKADADVYAQARASAEAVLVILGEHPERFAEMAQEHSVCSSASQGGNLGQIAEGQTTPEFEQALFELEPGSIGRGLVATRYGFHIIRIDRKHEGRELPYELVADRIADYLQESVQRRALAQYVARLAIAAQIEGVELTSAEAMRVN